MIKTVIFDIGNVLTKFGWKEFFESFGYSSDVVERLGNATVKSDTWEQYDLGNWSDEKILDSFIQHDTSIEAQLRFVFKNLHGIVTRLDYAIPWIKELRAKNLQILFLSNFSHKILMDCYDALDFLPYTDGGILSYTVHKIKPNPDIYELLINRYKLIPSECIFIDDTLKNVEAAKNLGIHAFQFIDYESASVTLSLYDI